MDRPSTSKARGICSYYTTSRGCWAKDNCKFLHGENQKLTPYDKSKTCKFYANGYCLRGDGCWFRHAAPKSPPQQDDEEVDANDMCNICLEKPDTYGLLAGCGHAFCVKCIRQWRDPSDKSGDMVFSGVIKKCPLCRSLSKFITPSSILLSHNDPEKVVAFDKYKASMARVPCRYFQQSRPSKRFCPFGKDCFYQHRNEDGTPFIFPHGVDYYMRLYKSRQRRVAFENDSYAGDMTNILDRLFNNPFEHLSATIEALRVNLPAFLERLSMEDMNGDGDDGTDEGDDLETEQLRDDIAGGGGDGFNDTERTLERLADQMLESLAALRESAQPSPTPASQSNIPEELPVELRSLEALSGPSSLTTFELTSPRESTAPSPLPVPPAPRTPSVSATSRFSTVVGNRSQERILIDLSESEDEGEDGGDGDDARASDEIEHDPVVGASDDSTIAEAPDVEREIAPRSDNVIQETEAPLPEMSDLERRAAAGSVTVIAGEVGSGESTSSRTVDRVSVEHDHDAELEPPFVTDGRGRVVWSSTRSSGRGTRVQVQGQAETVSRESPGQGQVQVQGAVRTPAGTTTASERRTKARRTVTAREPSSDPTAITTESTGFTTDGRGRVIWTASNPPSPALQIPTPARDTAGSGAAQVGAVQLEGCSEPRADAEIEGGMGTENVVADENSDNDGSRRSFFGRVLDVVFLNS